MHTYVLISLFSSLASGMLAGAIWARDPTNRRNRLAASLLACTAFWSLCDVFANLADDPVVALEFIRWSCLGSIMVGPLALHILMTLHPTVEARYARFLRGLYVLSAGMAIVAVATGAFWPAVHPTHWGWGGVASIWVGVSWALIVPLPFAALFDWLRFRERSEPVNPVLAVAVCIPALVATLTDFVLPHAGVDAPRLGSASLVAWGAVALWTVYRFRDPVLAPHRYAGEILRTLPDGVMLLRTDGTIRAANRKLSELAATPVDELPGRHVHEVLPDPAHARPSVTDQRELRLARSSGDPLPVAVQESPLHDEDGHPLGRVLVVRDLSEVVSLRSRLITSGRLAAIGQLAAGIAHEINNPVAYTQSNLNRLRVHWETARTELAKHALSERSSDALCDGTALIEETGAGLARVAEIVRDVGGFSRTPDAAVEATDVHTLIDTAVRVAHPQLSDRIHVRRRYGQVPPVACCPSELVQVFLNLLQNAAHAIADRGTVDITTDAVAGRVRVRLRDDGPGIDPAIVEQIFDPFFTTKAVGEGTGLGLSISRQIVERYGGTLLVSSAPEQGTTFTLELPAAGPTDGAC